MHSLHRELIERARRLGLLKPVIHHRGTRRPRLIGRLGDRQVSIPVRLTNHGGWRTTRNCLARINKQLSTIEDAEASS